MKIMRDIRWLQITEAAAIEGPGCSGAKVGAILIYKNMMISKGWNSSRTHPLALKFGKNSKALCVHAELDVLIKADRQLDKRSMASATLYICRVKRIDSYNKYQYIWGLSKPCDGCVKAIIAYNVGRVVYTLDGPDRLFEVVE
jgi:deoxycytidylate deaminase